VQNFTTEFRAMGSHIQAWVTVREKADAIMLNDVRGWFEHWEAVFSRFRPESELSEVNQQAGQWVQVSPEFFAVLRLAVQAAEDTDGVFNPLILGALEAAGYDHSFDPEHFIPASAPRKAVPVPDHHQIEIDARRRMVRFPKEARLDLSGIVKGWAAQETALRLEMIGPCLVDAGGDMVMRGSPDASGGWLASVTDPLTNETAYTVRLTDAAIATSGTDYRNWTRDGQRFHHLIDPRTGQPSDSPIVTATVIAPNAVQAEIWAKAGLISGILPALPSLFINYDGTRRFNPEFEALCKTVTEAH